MKWLAFDLPLSKQLRGQVSPEDGALLDSLNEAKKHLVSHGIIRKERIPAVEKQIFLLAQRLKKP